MDLRAFDLNLLVTFDAIDRERSVNGAAARLGLSQPAMSYTLSKLRRQFGDQLFVRTSHGMLPTPLSERLRDPVRRTLATVRDEVLAPQEFDPRASTRTFVFCMSDVGETVFLPILVNHLQRVAPGINVRTLNLPRATVAEALHSGDADLAVGYFPELLKGGIFQQLLFRHTYLCMVRRDHPTVRDTLTPKQFVALPHLLVGPEGKSHEVFERDLVRLGVRRRILARVNNFLAALPLIEHSDMIVTVPHAIGAMFAERHNLKVLAPPFKTAPIVIRQHWQRRFQSDPAHRWMRQLIYELFGASGLYNNAGAADTPKRIRPSGSRSRAPTAPRLR